jgi:hypothetical protein
MIPRWSLSLLFAAGAYAASVESNAPVKNFTLPTFTKEGYRAVLLRGNEALLVNPQRLDVTGMQLTMFTGDASNRVETVIVSPQASFFPDRNLARGEHGVRLIRDDAEMSGTRWSYTQDRTQKKVAIDGNVRVIFRTEIGDILK